MEHLTDTTTYRLASEYPTTEIKRQITNIVISFKPHLEPLNKRLYKHLSTTPKASQIPQFYGLPKIHKKFTKLPPMRPIVSQTLSLLKPTAQFIDHVLQPLARSYPDYLHNSTSLVNILQDLQPPDDCILVTIDVSSLYPSIPQSECLNIIYTEMRKHRDLLLTDPNLIIHLLHLNVNYNYFAFAHLIFQQTMGTAMGAAFSPTIANIFMSTVLGKFINSQPKKPLLLTRYIDDIFLIWTNTQRELEYFLTSLNSFHPNLKFTHGSSPQSIDFLDLTIYKGNNFAYTNILDIKTYQKPRNLYQYLHFTSNHPTKIFKAIIKGECIRFARTNTTQEGYEAMVHLLKLRLKRQGYPAELLQKATCLVKYSHRHRYLRHGEKPISTTSPPVYKALPPPQFKVLKHLVLQDYPKLQFLSPRFIALRHPTVSNILVRTKLTATDEQFVDMSILFADKSATSHKTIADLPQFSYEKMTIQPCRKFNCSTCRHHLLTTPTFKANRKNSDTFSIRHKLSCQSKNIIYLITCMRCKKQYVGQTSNQLNTRINQHRTSILNKKSILIAKHFNLPGHSILDLKVQPIDQATSKKPSEELHHLETFWIKTLRTLTPHGLNVHPGIKL